VNPAASTASYRLTLPDRLGRVRVIVADGPARIFDVGDGTVNIELGGR
jgi:hypothetical protein